MNKGIILNLKRFKLLDYVNHNKIFIILCILYVTGIIISVFALSESNQILINAETHLNNYISIHNNGTFINKFTKCFLQYFIILVLYFISGTSFFGVAVIPFLMLWQGILIGAVSSRLYSIYGIAGIAFNAILIIPPTAIFVITCFFAAKYSIDFSLTLARITLPHCKPTSVYATFKKYCSVYLILIGISLICVFIEIILNVLFLDFFNF